MRRSQPTPFSACCEPLEARRLMSFSLAVAASSGSFPVARDFNNDGRLDLALLFFGLDFPGSHDHFGILLGQWSIIGTAPERTDPNGRICGAIETRLEFDCRQRELAGGRRALCACPDRD